MCHGSECAGSLNQGSVLNPMRGSWACRRRLRPTSCTLRRLWWAASWQVRADSRQLVQSVTFACFHPSDESRVSPERKEYGGERAAEGSSAVFPRKGRSVSIAEADAGSLTLATCVVSCFPLFYFIFILFLFSPILISPTNIFVDKNIFVSLCPWARFLTLEL